MSDKLELIVGPGDAYRGPSQGHSPEHGDNWMDAVEKINGAISAINDLRGVSNAPSNAVSIAPSMPAAATIDERLENLELAVAKMMDWMGLDAEITTEEPTTTAENTPPEPLLGKAHPAPDTSGAIMGSAGDITFGQPVADGPDAQPPAEPSPNALRDNPSQEGTLGGALRGEGQIIGETQMPDAVVTDGHPEPAEAFTQTADGTFHPITPTPDASGVVLTGNDGKPQDDQFAGEPAPIATFEGQPGIPVGGTKDEEHDDNRFVASGATGRVEAEQPVDKLEQKPGADPDSRLIYPDNGTDPDQAPPILNTSDAEKSPVEREPQAGAGSVSPGIAALADAERSIEAQQERDDVEVNSPSQDPFDAVDNPATPPSQETIERADATAANNVRQGG